MGVVVVVKRQPQLLQMILALCSASRFTSLLNGREQEGDEDRDDRDHHQHFNEREHAANVERRTFSTGLMEAPRAKGLVPRSSETAPR